MVYNGTNSPSCALLYMLYKQNFGKVWGQKKGHKAYQLLEIDV